MAKDNPLSARRLWIALLLLAALLLPLVLENPYHRQIMVTAVLFIILSSGLNLIVGYAGLLAFGYTAFFAIGAYGATLATLHGGVPFWLAIAAGAAISGVIAYGLGYPCLRLQGPYFAIVTFAFSEVIRLVATGWISVTNGPMGLRNPIVPVLKLPWLPELRLNSEIAFYYLALVLLLLVLAVKARLLDSRFGRAFVGLRENVKLAAAVGIDPFRYKMQAWVVSAVFAGVAGAGYALYFRIVDPTLFSLYYIFLVFSMVLIGGAGTIAGPILGGLLFTALPEMLRISQGYRMILFSGLLLLCVVFVPNGIVGIFRRFTRRKET
jgi:branched-chain amino acid transport system permease protein